MHQLFGLLKANLRHRPPEWSRYDRLEFQHAYRGSLGPVASPDRRIEASFILDTQEIGSASALAMGGRPGATRDVLTEEFTPTYESRRVCVSTYQGGTIFGRDHGPILTFGGSHYEANLSRAQHRHLRTPHIVNPYRRFRRIFVRSTALADLPSLDRPVLCCRSWGNWALFVRHTLSALIAFEKAGADLTKSILLTNGISPGKLPILAALGISRKRIVRLNGWYKADQLMTVKLHEHNQFHGPPTLMSEAADRLVGKLGSTGPRKIYVSRRLATRRRVLREAEMEAHFTREGYVCVDPGALSPREQVALFSNAETIVGPHGMGMANAVFAPRLKHLVELMSTEWSRPSYCRTAQLRGAAYGAYFEQPDAKGDLAGDPAFLDFVADITSR